MGRRWTPWCASCTDYFWVVSGNEWLMTGTARNGLGTEWEQDISLIHFNVFFWKRRSVGGPWVIIFISVSTNVRKKLGTKGCTECCLYIYEEQNGWGKIKWKKKFTPEIAVAEHRENDLCLSSEDHVTTYRGNKKIKFDAKPGGWQSKTWA